MAGAAFEPSRHLGVVGAHRRRRLPRRSLVVVDNAVPLEVDEALVVFEVLKDQDRVLVPATSEYYPGSISSDVD